MIKGTTKMMCLLGNPVNHSLSPALHNELCRLNDFDGFYAAFAPAKESLEQAIKGIQSLGGIGFNVTYPYKEAVIPFLDEIHEDAKVLNAVNTVVVENGRLKGYNTDVYGVEQLMIKNNITVKNNCACIFGTGGASRAVSVALLKQGVKRIDFYSRKVKPNAFIDKIGATAEVNNYSYDEFNGHKMDYDILINGTPLGMGSMKNERAITPEGLKTKAFVVDLIYSPSKTNLLTVAGDNGYNIVNGYDMLYYQGLKAFDLWTGIYIDYYDAIKKLLINESVDA